MSGNYHSTLIAAIEGARDEEISDGISADRRVYNDGTIAWRVQFGIDVDHSIVITSEDCSAMSNEEIAALIEHSWEADFDTVQIDEPVGDYRIGSSDFCSREALRH